jgi:acylphosphatase
MARDADRTRTLRQSGAWLLTESGADSSFTAMCRGFSTGTQPGTRRATRGWRGWAANRSDGAVEVVLEGPPEAVESVAGYCRTGPSSAEVRSVDEHEETPEGLTGFQIR